MDVNGDRLRRYWRGPFNGRAFARDERGGTAVQALVFLPVILLSMVLMIWFWQTLTIRRSLHTGTYLATRYLSLYTPETTDTGEWAAIAKKFIYAELRNNPYVDELRVKGDLADLYAPVEVTLQNGNKCKSDFTIKAKYAFMAPLNFSQTQLMPAMERYALEDERKGKVLCSK
jgi:Flp pilus assembly protein TadG